MTTLNTSTKTTNRGKGSKRIAAPIASSGEKATTARLEGNAKDVIVEAEDVMPEMPRGSLGVAAEDGSKSSTVTKAGPINATASSERQKVSQGGTATAAPARKISARGSASPWAPAATAAGTATKTAQVLKKLQAPRGTTLAAIMNETGWQAHSVRGFLSGTVRKKLGLTLASEVGKDGVRRYRVTGAAA